MLCNSNKKIMCPKINFEAWEKKLQRFYEKSKGISSSLHATHPNMKDNFNTYVHHHGYNICTPKIKTKFWYTYTYITSYNKWFIYTTLYNMFFFVCFFKKCRYLYHILYENLNTSNFFTSMSSTFNVNSLSNIVKMLLHTIFNLSTFMMLPKNRSNII